MALTSFMMASMSAPRTASERPAWMSPRIQMCAPLNSPPRYRRVASLSSITTCTKKEGARCFAVASADGRRNLVLLVVAQTVGRHGADIGGHKVLLSDRPRAKGNFGGEPVDQGARCNGTRKAAGHR